MAFSPANPISPGPLIWSSLSWALIVFLNSSPHVSTLCGWSSIGALFVPRSFSRVKTKRRGPCFTPRYPRLWPTVLLRKSWVHVISTWLQRGERRHSPLRPLNPAADLSGSEGHAQRSRSAPAPRRTWWPTQRQWSVWGFLFPPVSFNVRCVSLDACRYRPSIVQTVERCTVVGQPRNFTEEC